MSTKFEALKKLITSNNLEFIMEAHNALSARIVEQAGFKGIWASGLTISAALGVRDSNEASWTQILEVLEFMSDATQVPILVDGDTGYGDFNNARRLANKLEQREIAGVCIEDKLFPKTNSFISGETQPLADIDEFCGKIKAIKDAQKNNNFVVVARVEAFIAGWGMAEAVRRAEAYRKAGADAILIHSKKYDSSDIEAFMKEWGDRHPVVIVPTKYYSVPTEAFRDMRISLVVWANHNLRASISYMQKITSQIFKDESLINVEDKIVPVSEVFRLQKADELKEAEKQYLPASEKNMNAVILAASQGDRFGGLTEELPKTLLKVAGKSILAHQMDEFNMVGIKDITIVRGFAKQRVTAVNAKMIDNDDFAATRELYSLFLAMDEIKENTVISYGDIIFRGYILNDLLNDGNNITLIVDADYEKRKDIYYDYVQCDIPYSRKVFSKTVKFKKMATDLKKENIHGEFIGLYKVNRKGAEIVKKTLQELALEGNFKQLRMNDLFNRIAKSCDIAVKYIKGSWIDINTIVDLQKAGDF